MTAETPASPEVDRFLSKLRGVRRNGAGWSACCPCRNDDNNPSLSIGQGRDGRVLVTCHRGVPCDVNAICDSMGMAVSELMPKTTRPEKQKLKLVKNYDYTDENGQLLFQKQRFVDDSGRKTFRQRRKSPAGEWIYNLDGVSPVLYNLPRVIQAKADDQVIWVVEGEKDADTLNDLGYVATTMPGGAGKWKEIHTEVLSGGKVIVVADNDEVGRKHAIDVAEALKQAGARVKLRIPESHKDLTDMLEAGLQLGDLAKFSADGIVGEPNHYDIALDKIKKVFDNPDYSEDTKINRAELIIRTLDGKSGGVKNDFRLVEWDSFIQEEENDEYDWVIPNLLERGERVMVVAAEGVGKTMLARQVALCTAAGLHPFKFTKIPPMKTLMIDLENPERIIRRTSKNIWMSALGHGHKLKPSAKLLIKPDGIDLLKVSDRLMIEDVMEEVRPDIVFLGPVYKSFIDPGGRTSEAIAIEIAKYFDTLREYFKCAMWFEHHAPLGSAISTRDLRPFGSAVWSRWPEFGISLQPDPTSDEGFVYEVKHFRGARDKREWPTKMKRGKVFPFDVIEFMRADL